MHRTGLVVLVKDESTGTRTAAVLLPQPPSQDPKAKVYLETRLIRYIHAGREAFVSTKNLEVYTKKQDPHWRKTVKFIAAKGLPSQRAALLGARSSTRHPRNSGAAIDTADVTTTPTAAHYVANTASAPAGLVLSGLGPDSSDHDIQPAQHMEGGVNGSTSSVGPEVLDFVATVTANPFLCDTYKESGISEEMLKIVCARFREEQEKSVLLEDNETLGKEHAATAKKMKGLKRQNDYLNASEKEVDKQVSEDKADILRVKCQVSKCDAPILTRNERNQNKVKEVKELKELVPSFA